MKKSIIASLLLTIAAPVAAQPVVIHGHPQKAAYAGPAEWPFPSGQCHWPSNDMGTLGHTHDDLNIPMFGEVLGPFVARFAVKLFHTAGKIVGFYPEHTRDMIWDATGSTTLPDLTGDPMGLKVWTGHLTVDLTTDTYPYPPVLHGWTRVGLVSVTQLTNGDQIVSRLYVPVWSMLDPSVPVPAFNPFQLTANCAPFSPRRQDISFGVTGVAYSDQFVPIAPIAAPWANKVTSSGYGTSDGVPPAVVEQRRDLDLHNGVPGVLLSRVTGIKNLDDDIVWDPAEMGPGSHKAMVMRDQVDGAEEIAALLVLDIATTVAVPPPALCTDPTATNIGQPLPCVFPPPPPPPPVFTVFTFTCDAAGKCQLVVK